MNYWFKKENTFKTILKYIGIVVLSFLGFMLFVLFFIFPFANNCYEGSQIYEYEDLNGNIGTAYHCQYSDASDYARKGGQGQPICIVGKKTIVVKWYEDKTEYGNCWKLTFGKGE